MPRVRPCRRRGFSCQEFLFSDPEVRAETDVKGHFCVQCLVNQGSEPAHVTHLRRLGNPKRDGAAKVDQEHVVLLHVVLETVEGQGPVADTRDEGMTLLTLPNGCCAAPEFV